MKLLLRLFPRRFRDRYGDEVVDLFEADGSRPRDAADLAMSGLSMRVHQLARRLRQRAGLVAGTAPLALGAGAAASLLVGCAIVGAAAGGAGGLYAGAIAVLLAWPANFRPKRANDS
jgi:hypothetical protein